MWLTVIPRAFRSAQSHDSRFCRLHEPGRSVFLGIPFHALHYGKTDVEAEGNCVVAIVSTWNNSLNRRLIRLFLQTNLVYVGLDQQACHSPFSKAELFLPPCYSWEQLFRLLGFFYFRSPVRTHPLCHLCVST